MLSGPEVFTQIFLQFLPKTRLAKYDHHELGNFCPGTRSVYQFEYDLCLSKTHTKRPLQSDHVK